MSIPKYPRYSFVKTMAYSILIKNEINTLPIKFSELLKNYENIKLIKYSQYAKNKNIPLSEAIKEIKSEDGITYYEKGLPYIIFYNDSKQMIVNKRITWTIAHELGHIFLGHFDFDKTILHREGLNVNEYKVLEDEAHFFAKILLSIPPVLDELKIKDARILTDLCNISKQAATSCFNYYINHYRRYDKSLLDYNIVSQFRYSLDYHKYDAVLFNRCHICGAKLQKYPNNKFCHICGSRSRNKKIEKEKFMFYKSIEINDKSKRLNTCLVCDNEDISEDSNYCKICGTPVLNQCSRALYCNNNSVNSNADFCNIKYLDGNARFCSDCGNISTFYEKELLQSWEDEAVPF